jgi:hypothetical protein
MQQGLKKAVNQVDKYCSEWDLDVNTNRNKCVVVFKKRGRLKKSEGWKVWGQQIEIVS